MNNCIRPEHWVRTSVSVTADITRLFGVRYTGSQVAAHITVSGAATTGIKFEQGASTAAAAVGTGTNPGTTGVINCNNKTYHAIIREINVGGGDDWEAWPIAALPDVDSSVTAGTSKMLPVSDADCTGASGYAVLQDDSDASTQQAALSFAGPSSEPHAHDASSLHELLQIRHNRSSSTTGSLVVYACDDVAGTKETILTVPFVATDSTENYYPGDSTTALGEPIANADNKRIVVQLAIDTWAGTPTLFISGRSYQYGPGMRKSKTWSEY